MSEPPSQPSSQTSQPPPPSTQPLPSTDQSITIPPSSSEATIVPKLEPESSDAATAAVLTDPNLDPDTADPMAGNNHITTAAADAVPETSGIAIATEPATAPEEEPTIQPTSVDAAQSSKKETSLREFLGKMDDYAPIIPDAVTSHYLTLAGLPPPGTGPNQTPPHLARLLALATQKFISDIAADSYQYARIRASNSTSASNPMGSLNAASGLGVPGAGGAGAAGGGAGETGKSGGGGSGGAAGKAGTHLGIQRAGFGGGGSGGSGQGRTVLTMEDLGMAVSEYGVSVKRGEFYR
ncbi:transcription initiation factor TFIID 23-30kDa subunit-domain-containing protein [Aspergillus cavernicola]|uniref:Transcription initiation factor TFIID 23-30kDa subunit-domain-containing protein n=1 Tax=Aspergillus cavernicola TaxID=176166 RepID=A0ABR4ISK3_9EURO